MTQIVEASACNAGNLCLIPELGRSLEKGMAITTIFLSGEFHGQRSREGYCPWNHKESDITEQLIHTHTQAFSKHLLCSYVLTNS